MTNFSGVSAEVQNKTEEQEHARKEKSLAALSRKTRQALFSPQLVSSKSEPTLSQPAS